jgi:hypothetical protein
MYDLVDKDLGALECAARNGALLITEEKGGRGHLGFIGGVLGITAF